MRQQPSWETHDETLYESYIRLTREASMQNIDIMHASATQIKTLNYARMRYSDQALDTSLHMPQNLIQASASRT